MLIQDYLDICDPVLTFDRFMGEIELEKYLKNIPQHYTGRRSYALPNGKNFYLQHRKNVKGNKYGRQEEVYQCEDCSGCPYAEQCKKTDKNRTVRIKRELTAMHQEVIADLESIQGALLRMNRSIQAEGTFGIMKNDRWYKRIVRRGIKSVLLEVFLVSIGHNLYKYHNKQNCV